MLKFAKGWKIAGAAVVAAGLLVAGCSNDDSDTVETPPAPSTLSVQGTVVQGPVAGARVFADRPPFNNSWDASEEFTFTAEDGSYSFPVIDGDFRLCTEGGVDTLANKPAFPMLAPKGAANITPLTTLVALAPTPEAATQVKNMIDKLAGNTGTTSVFDADPTAGIPASLMTLVKSLEAVIEVFETNFGITDPAAQQGIVQEIGTQLVTSLAASPAADPVVIMQTALTGTVSAKIETLQGDTYQLPGDPGAKADAISALANTVNGLVGNIATAVGTGTVVENAALQNNVQNQTSGATTTITNNVVVETVSLSLANYQVQDANGADLDSNPDAKIITVPASQAALVHVEVNGKNTFAVDKSYAGATLRLQIDDVASSRLVTFNLSGLGIAVAPGGAITVNDAAAVLNVTAVDSAGNVIAANPVAGPFDSIVFDGSSVTFDLPAIQQKLAAQSAADFGTINQIGSYDVSASIVGAPAVGTAIRLNAN